MNDQGAGGHLVFVAASQAPQSSIAQESANQVVVKSLTVLRDTNTQIIMLNLRKLGYPNASHLCTSVEALRNQSFLHICTHLSSSIKIDINLFELRNLRSYQNLRVRSRFPAFIRANRN